MVWRSDDRWRGSKVDGFLLVWPKEWLGPRRGQCDWSPVLKRRQSLLAVEFCSREAR